MPTTWFERVENTGVLDWIWDGRLAERGYSPDELATTARILARPCPTCQAESGAWCRFLSTGEPIEDLDRQHVARRAPWRRENGLDL